MRHPKAVAWEQKLKAVFDRIDHELEEKYSDYPLHPSRPPHGTTSSPAYDGLFNLGASFSAGYGSEHGAGYVVEVRMVTLSHVPEDVREQIEEEVVTRLEEQLPRVFPNRKLQVLRDGPRYKIVGDLSLGNV